MRYIARRLLHSLFLLASVSVLAFVLFEIAPGDYLDEMRANPQIPAATVEKYRHDFGLEHAPHVRYGRWLAAALRGDLGQSFVYGMPVAYLLRPRVLNTLLLSLAALLLTWCVAVPLGAWSAAKWRSVASTAAETAAGILVSLPDLLVGLICLVLAVRTGWFRVAGSFSLAVLACSMVAFPAVFRHTRRNVADVLRQPFTEHLRACGVSESRILFAHVLPAALHPLITLLGLSVAALLSSSLIVEVVLGWPGLGPLLLEAILARDFPVVIAAVLLATLMLAIANLASDLVLYLADPRIRRDEL